jgi:hypothetical protein
MLSRRVRISLPDTCHSAPPAVGRQDSFDGVVALQAPSGPWAAIRRSELGSAKAVVTAV